MNSRALLAHEPGAKRGHVEVVEHDDVDASGRDVAVRAHVGRHGAAGEPEPIRPCRGQFDVRERLDLLRPPIFEDLEIIRREAGHEVALRVGDRHVHIDVVDAQLERGSLGFGRLRSRGAPHQRATTGGQRAIVWFLDPKCEVMGVSHRDTGCASWTKILTGLSSLSYSRRFSHQYIGGPMKRKMLARVVLLTVLCAAWASADAAAQNVYGSLVGNVTDSSGGAIPGATVTATQTQTNLTREVVTNESGAYSIPNIPSGTYQVVVAVPGFQNFTVRDIGVTNRDVRVDARLSLGALEEAVTVTATAAILQTENAAVQHVANSEQLQTLPTSGRAFQSFMTLMPGVGEPNYQQSGGINNPGRTMSLTVNGQPATNTVVRLDGITATNQFFESIQSYGPSLEAIETVNVVTSSFDADQGMAGAAAVNVQVKSGTNIFKRLGVRLCGGRADARAQLLSARGSEQGHLERARARRHDRRADCQEQAVLLLQRRDDGSANEGRQRPGADRDERVHLAAARRPAPGRFLWNEHRHLRPADR